MSAKRRGSRCGRSGNVVATGGGIDNVTNFRPSMQKDGFIREFRGRECRRNLIRCGRARAADRDRQPPGPNTTQLAAYILVNRSGVCPLPPGLFPPLLRLRQHSPVFPEESKK
jgi:hypothetical protein